MKKRFLFSTLAAFFALGCSVFTSCSDDDDDDDGANVTISINGSDVADKGAVLLAKSTTSMKTSGDTVSLNITSNKEFSGVELIVNNKFAKDVIIVDVDGKAYNGKGTEAPATTKSIKFIGVLGSYTLRAAGKTVSFSLKNEKEKADYEGNSRNLSNKQTVIYDATGAEFSEEIFGMKYVNNTVDEVKYLNGKMSTITEEEYTTASTDLSKEEFGDMGEAEGRVFSEKKNISSTPAFFIYNNGDKFYLVKVVSINGDILTAEVQY